MGEEIKPIVIKKTQDLLGKFLKRPPLTEKLLKKPPFRFLHDIITAVIRQYGLMEGLFTADEMVSDNVKDKESKIAFLQKVIDTMKLVTGANLTVRPSKIVAGQEADKTNELLQAIAKALDKKLSSKKAVDQVLGKSKEPGASDTASKVKTKETKATKEVVNGKEKISSRKRSDATDKKPAEKKERSKVGSKEATTKRTKKPSPEKHVVDNVVEEQVDAPPAPLPLAVEQLPSLGATEEQLAPSYEPSAPELTPEPSIQPNSLPFQTEVPGSTAELGEVLPSDESSQPKPSVTPAPSTSQLESSEPIVLGNDQPIQPSPPNSSTEASRAPTAVASSPIAVTRPGSVRPGSAKPRPITARPAAPRLKERVVRPALEETQPEPVVNTPNLILDSGKVEEDDSTFIVEEDQPTMQDIDAVLEEAPTLPTSVLESGEPQGHLVTQILGTQRELEDTKDNQQAEEYKWTGREVARKEVSRLREAVQGLVRAANPLARLLDFLQEDVESMQLELEQWSGENSKLSLDIAREKMITLESLQPLQKELAELITQVETQKQMNAALKTAVILNDNKLMSTLLKD